VRREVNGKEGEEQSSGDARAQWQAGKLVAWDAESGSREVTLDCCFRLIFLAKMPVSGAADDEEEGEQQLQVGDRVRLHSLKESRAQAMLASWWPGTPGRAARRSRWTVAVACG
jgi:hypothetical protein